MKKLICLILILTLAACFAACGGKTVATGTTETSPAAETTTSEKQSKSDAKPASSGSIDVDLTQMSATMVYSEVQNMMMSPQDYKGKTVKMHGAFSVAEIGANRYFACIIKDATACCSQGIEFKWAGEHSYPDDYPEQGQEITVTGTFGTYLEGEQVYCELEDSDVQF